MSNMGGEDSFNKQESEANSMSSSVKNVTLPQISSSGGDSPNSRF